MGAVFQSHGDPIDNLTESSTDRSITMAEESKTQAPATEIARESDAHSGNDFVDRPKGWIYKGFRFRGKEIWYASPTVQLLMVSLVCFMCPGMFNALGGLGGGGQVDKKAQMYANTALYGVFAVVGFFSGTIANVLGLRLTIAFGGVGYALYASSFLAYNHIQSLEFTVFAGAFLGLCAGLLWTAQGAVMMSYPTEDMKGRYISWFWVIFNTGAVIGSLIPLAENIHRTAGPVTDGTYAAFIILMFIGLVLGIFLVNADKVIREDGTKVILMKNPSWKTEFIGLWETLFQDPWIGILFPLTMVIWGGGFAWQDKQVSRKVATSEEYQANSLVDWTDGGEKFIGPMFLYFFYGFFDAVWQTCIYWYMGALSNSGRKAANLAGFYKGLQSAGACIYWGLDSSGMSYDLMFAVTWGLLGAALVIGAPVIFMRIKDTVTMEEDLKFSDETIEDVVVGAHNNDAKLAA